MPKFIKASRSTTASEARDIARQAVLAMVQSGWRETDAALSLADAMDDYCLHLVRSRDHRHMAANSN
ncbi:hypothetical protein IHQ71_30775 (plasmid) [Rhizobium sp. TH2]|uniref:hypothetical protein n=1 Tax=Rhizobium sp. TH2 TaxID=2775403 RepID=UPI00215874B2|nr:hypothetical protein [Rhizobium sp. TH2]UVC12390.1 hypothetical protein IHQ71_30775 [Rhizobium sp. TH2]